MTTTTYPNTQQLVSSALTISQVNAVLQPLTLGMLGLLVEINSSAVRVEWPKEGAPFVNTPDDDVCFLRCVPEDGEYNKVRDKAVIKNDDDAESITERFSYTRVWRITWCLYGPNSTDRARAIKSAIFEVDYFLDQLSLSQLFPVSEYGEPVRAPENIDGQWFERVDYEVTMYEFVVETIIDQSVKSVEVKTFEHAGQFADFTVTGS